MMSTRCNCTALVIVLVLLLVSCGGGGDRKIGDFPGGFLTWSPNGQKIAFLYNGIYTMNADGSGGIKVNEVADGVRGLAWSPDGTRIAIAFNGGVWTCAVDGSNLAPVVPVAYGDQSWGVSWSPDGSRIAFGTTISGEGWDIYVAEVEGGDPIRLTSEETYDYAPSWSPDGSKIVFHSATDVGERWDIYVMNADGSSRTKLTYGPGGNYAPAWSPDGRKIAFISHREGDPEIYLMDADGGNVATLIEGSVTVMPGAGAPAWSPDGTRIAFSGLSKVDEHYIYVIDVPEDLR